MMNSNTIMPELPQARFVDVPSIMRLLSLLPINNESAFLIQFTSPEAGTGVSSITRDFAVVACTNLGLKVLLVSLEGAHGSVQETVRDRYNLASQETKPTHASAAKKEFSLFIVENPTIKLSIAMFDKQERSEAFLSNWVDFLEASRNEFDLVLIDSMPLNRSYIAVTLCSKVDANIIVVAAEDTSVAATKNLMNRLEEKDGPVLGCILNKRHFYIPDFIYKKV